LLVSRQNFYKEMEREEIYIRYIYSLAQLQKDSGNYVEAGFTLLLHAELLQVLGVWCVEGGVALGWVMVILYQQG